MLTHNFSSNFPDLKTSASFISSRFITLCGLCLSNTFQALPRKVNFQKLAENESEEAEISKLI